MKDAFGLPMVLVFMASMFAPLFAIETVEIVAPPTVPEHSLVMVQTSENGTDYAWTVLGPRGEEQVAVFGRQAVFCGPPGRYAILQAWTTATGEKRQAFTFTTILPGDDQEESDPPVPRPPEPPVVTPGPRWIVVVEETAERTPQQAAVLTNSGFRQWITTAGHDCRMIDKDVLTPTGSVPTDCAPYLDLAKGQTLPRLFIVDGCSGDSQGKVLFAGDLPATADALKTLIQQKGG